MKIKIMAKMVSDDNLTSFNEKLSQALEVLHAKKQQIPSNDCIFGTQNVGEVGKITLIPSNVGGRYSDGSFATTFATLIKWEEFSNE